MMRLKFRSPGIPMRFGDSKPELEEVLDGGPDKRQQDVAANERFSRASDKLHGYRSAVSADETKGLSPAERFAQASARKWSSYDPFGRIADLRRRRSD
jgi:hypothetical protein